MLDLMFGWVTTGATHTAETIVSLTQTGMTFGTSGKNQRPDSKIIKKSMKSKILVGTNWVNMISRQWSTTSPAVQVSTILF